jgi:hypothetical protein
MFIHIVLVKKCCGSASHHFDADRYPKPDPTFHFVSDFDADPEPAYQNDADPSDPDLKH